MPTRDYDNSGSIVFKRKVGRPDPQQIAEKCVKACKTGKVTTVEGDEMDIGFESICFHSDTPGALEMGKAIRSALLNAGITIASRFHGSGSIQISDKDNNMADVLSPLPRHFLSPPHRLRMIPLNRPAMRSRSAIPLGLSK